MCHFGLEELNGTKAKQINLKILTMIIVGKLVGTKKMTQKEQRMLGKTSKKLKKETIWHFMDMVAIMI